MRKKRVIVKIVLRGDLCKKAFEKMKSVHQGFDDWLDLSEYNKEGGCKKEYGFSRNDRLKFLIGFLVF